VDRSVLSDRWLKVIPVDHVTVVLELVLVGTPGCATQIGTKSIVGDEPSRT